MTRRPGTGIRLLLFLAACAGGAVLLAIGFAPGASDRLPVLALALLLALVAVWRPERAVVGFAFLFPWSAMLARLFGGTEPLAWPLLLFSGLAAGWSFRFIYDFDGTPEPSGWDPVLRALAAVWILGGAVALARVHTVWALRHGLIGRIVNGAGLSEEAAVRESVVALAVLLCGAGFFFVLRRSGPNVRQAALTAALAGVSMSAFAAVLQRAGLLSDASRSFWKLTGRLSGGAMDPNALGLLCALGATVTAVWIAVAPERRAGLVAPRRRGWLAAPLVLMLAGLILSGSRSGLIVPMVGLPAVLLLRRRARRVAAVLGLAAAVGLAALLWLAPRSGTLAGRLAQTFDPSLPLQYRVSERPVLWRSAGRLFQRSPIEGAGLGAFSWTLPDLLAEQDRRLPMRDNPGSAYVQALAETGVVGFLLTLVLAVSLARHAVAGASDPAAEPIVVAAASAALGFLAAQVLGSHWLAPEVCLLFFLLASLVVRPPATAPGSRASPASSCARPCWSMRWPPSWPQRGPPDPRPPSGTMGSPASIPSSGRPADPSAGRAGSSRSGCRRGSRVPCGSPTSRRTSGRWRSRRARARRSPGGARSHPADPSLFAFRPLRRKEDPSSSASRARSCPSASASRMTGASSG